MEQIAGFYSMADNGALSFDKKHHQKRESEIFQVSAFPINGPILELEEWWERWGIMKTSRMTEADRSHLKCLSLSSCRVASVDSESMFVCVWRIGVLPLTHWCIFLFPWGEKEADILLIRSAFTLFFFVSIFCLMLLSFSWMALICFIFVIVIPLCCFIVMEIFICLHKCTDFLSFQINSTRLQILNAVFISEYIHILLKSIQNKILNATTFAHPTQYFYSFNFIFIPAFMFIAVAQTESDYKSGLRVFL